MKIVSDHQLLVELVREPGGELLAQEPLTELDHLGAEARWEAVRAGRLPDDPPRLSGRMTPVFGPDGAHVESIRIELQHADRAPDVVVMEFAASLAAPRAGELAAALTENGVLQSGDRYRSLLAAVPARPAAPGPQAEWDVEICESPFPVASGRLADRGIDAAVVAAADCERPVFVARSVVDQSIEDAMRHGNQETGTLLIGELVADPSLGASRAEPALNRGAAAAPWAVVVSDHVGVPDGLASNASFTFPPDSFRRARQLAELRGRAESVVGTQHSHGWRCHECMTNCEIRNLFFSSHDDRMARQFPVYAAFLVVGGDPDRDRNRPVMSCYVRRRGVMTPVPFGVF
jgi:hypothetical protein